MRRARTSHRCPRRPVSSRCSMRRTMRRTIRHCCTGRAPARRSVRRCNRVAQGRGHQSVHRRGRGVPILPELPPREAGMPPDRWRGTRRPCPTSGWQSTPLPTPTSRRNSSPGSCSRPPTVTTARLRGCTPPVPQVPVQNPNARGLRCDSRSLPFCSLPGRNATKRGECYQKTKEDAM